MHLSRQERALGALAVVAQVVVALVAGGCGSYTGELGPQEPQPLTGLQDGIITFYDADGTGNCSYEASPFDMDVAALTMAGGLYGNATWCGACAEVQGPLGTVVVRIVDSCPDCGEDHLDMSPQAFAKVAKLEDGRVAVKWRFVSCPLQGPVRYFFRSGSGEYWAEVQVRNHRVPVSKVEWLKAGSWEELPKKDYNYFAAEGGLGSGELRLRVTGWGGQVLEDTLPGVQAGGTLEGQGQFRAP